jgi:putative membrane protein
MRNLLLRFLINAVAIAVITSGLLPGIFIIGSPIPTIAVVALVFGLVNSLIKPLVRVLTCPFVLLTLGLFTFVVNGAMLYLAARLSELTVNLVRGQVVIENFGWAILGALVITLISIALEWILIRSAPPREMTARVVPETPLPSADPDFDFYDPKTGKFR